MFFCSELDFSSFEVEDEEKFFEQQLRRVVISLSGSPQTESPLPRPSHPPPQSPPHPTHTLSPSYTPGTEDKGTDLTHSPPSHILSCHTLTLPDTPVGHYSGEHSVCMQSVKTVGIITVCWGLGCELPLTLSHDHPGIYDSTQKNFLQSATRSLNL